MSSTTWSDDNSSLDMEINAKISRIDDRNQIMERLLHVSNSKKKGYENANARKVSTQLREMFTQMPIF